MWWLGSQIAQNRLPGGILGPCGAWGLKLAKIDLLGRFWSHVVAGGPNLPKSTSWGYSGAMWWLGAQTDQNRPPGAILGPCGGWGPKLAKIEVCKPFQFSCSITNPFSCSIKCKPFQFNSVVRLNANPVDERTIWKLILSISGACWPNGGFISTKPPLSPRTDLVHPHPPFWGHVVAGGPN